VNLLLFDFANSRDLLENFTLLTKMVHRWLQYWRTDKQVKCYLDELLVISNHGPGSSGNSLSPAAKRILGTSFLVIALLGIKCLQALYLCLSSHDEYHRLINYDVMLFWQCGAEWNFIIISLGLQIMYTLKIMYWNGQDRRMAMPILLHRQVVYRQDNRYFLDETLTNRKGMNCLVSERVRRLVTYYRVMYSYTVPFFSE